jgi:hypothetical protein
MAGNVSIGTAAPTTKLAVTGIIATTGGVRFGDGTTQTTAFYRPPPLPGLGAATTVDSAGDVGHYTSITFGADGLALISYYDSFNGDLKVLHCGNLLCNSSNISTSVDSVGTVGRFTSIATGADGLALISYLDNGNADLKVLHCSNLTCTPYTRVGR